MIDKINGYIVIRIEGYFAERFINICSSCGVKVSNIQQESPGLLVAEIGLKDYKKIRHIAKKTRCKIKIIKKCGVPFLLHKYRKRKWFLVAFLFCAGVIIYQNLFLWEVEITGEYDIPVTEITKQLDKFNVKVGGLKSKIDISKVKLEMPLLIDNLAWIGISIDGSKATVEIVSKDWEKEEELKGLPCNIIADRDGVIASIYSNEGINMVKVGDTVKAGDILISGVMASEFAEERLVHADGEVKVKTWYTQRVNVPYQKDIVSKTGNCEKRYKIKLFNIDINFLNNDTNFEKYDKISNVETLTLFGKYKLPIELAETVFYEVGVDTIYYTFEQASNAARNEAMRKVLELVPKESEVINNTFSIKEKDDSVEFEVIVECIEKVGTKEKIGG